MVKVDLKVQRTKEATCAVINSVNQLVPIWAKARVYASFKTKQQDLVTEYSIGLELHGLLYWLN